MAKKAVTSEEASGCLISIFDQAFSEALQLDPKVVHPVMIFGGAFISMMKNYMAMNAALAQEFKEMKEAGNVPS